MTAPDRRSSITRTVTECWPEENGPAQNPIRRLRRSFHREISRDQPTMNFRGTQFAREIRVLSKKAFGLRTKSGVDKLSPHQRSGESRPLAIAARMPHDARHI